MHPLFGPNRLEHMILGVSLAPKEVTSILHLLSEFADVFSWSHLDMSSVLPELAEHRFSV